MTEEKEKKSKEIIIHYNIYYNNKEKNTKFSFYLSLGVPSLFSIGIVLKQPVGNDCAISSKLLT